MQTQQTFYYDKIANAIAYIEQHFRKQPSLEAVAKHIHMSPFHFQRIFTEWAGTSPKKFLQYISIEHAKNMLRQDRLATVFDTAYETGLSGTGRLHDLFVNIEGMTPAEYKKEGLGLQINYSLAESPFGNLFVASTPKGICYMAFVENEPAGIRQLLAKFPRAHLRRKLDMLQQNALFIFQHDWSKLSEIKLHLKGTAFQLKVWETLLKIPMGALSTYGTIAAHLGNPDSARAVGTAIGSNPVAYLIPCHRVIQSTGHIGGYMWGSTRKSAIIGWEHARCDNSKM